MASRKVIISRAFLGAAGISVLVSGCGTYAAGPSPETKEKLACIMKQFEDNHVEDVHENVTTGDFVSVQARVGPARITFTVSTSKDGPLRATLAGYRDNPPVPLPAGEALRPIIKLSEDLAKNCGANPSKPAP